jgi:imidazolonepropionase-like amidohydrolase
VIQAQAAIALVNGTLIDGTAAAPIPNAVLLIDGDRIVAAGPAHRVVLPAGAKIYDLAGATILPGFIDVHVHRGFDEANLQAWARAGVTTVRDEGSGADNIKGLRTFQARIRRDPRNARLVSAGTMLGTYGGYGSLHVHTPQNARIAVLSEASRGVDAVKVALEDGYAGEHDLPNLTLENLKAIVDTAHAQGLPVSAHVTQARHVEALLDADVDDLAHLPYDCLPQQTLRRIVAADVYVVPTFSFYRNVGLPVSGLQMNLWRIVSMGGKVALGDDYGGDPGHYDLGMPMYDIEMMAQSGMTPMQIIEAGTRNAARVVGLDEDLGTLEAGKIADVLVVDGDPLQDLQSLMNVSLVIHDGTVIRDELGVQRL